MFRRCARRYGHHTLLEHGVVLTCVTFVAMNDLHPDNNFDTVSASTDAFGDTRTFFQSEICLSENRKPFLWELCPPEIRDLIFDDLDREDDWWHNPHFAWDSNECVPPFIVAVRTLPVTYAHALLRFKRLSASIHMDGRYGKHTHQLKDMTDMELKVFEKVEIDLRLALLPVRTESLPEELG